MKWERRARERGFTLIELLLILSSRRRRQLGRERGFTLIELLLILSSRRRRQLGCERGFTLIELLLAMFIFSMVMGGLAVIYSTAFKQGLRMLHETRLKGMGMMSSRALQSELTAATLLDIPPPNGAGTHLQGRQNMTIIDGVATQMVADAQWTKWFHFCISPNTTAPCGEKNFEPQCLWYYSGQGSVAPAIDDASCGQPAGGVQPQLLATHIVSPVPGPSGFFTRVPADEVAEANQVRANFVMRQGATQNHPPISFNLDVAYNMNFSP